VLAYVIGVIDSEFGKGIKKLKFRGSDVEKGVKHCPKYPGRLPYPVQKQTVQV
jgi:hypothetical protein